MLILFRFIMTKTLLMISHKNYYFNANEGFEIFFTPNSLYALLMGLL